MATARAWSAKALRSESSELDSEVAQTPRPIAAATAAAAAIAVSRSARSWAEDDDALRGTLLASLLQDAFAQRGGRRGAFGRVCQHPRRLAETGELRAAVVALAQVGLERAALAVVERV